jgi:hypothetical protein
MTEGLDRDASPARAASAAWASTWTCFAVALVVLVAAHAPLLSLPHHWDEAGYFVPAARDLLDHGDWIPTSVAPNVHPPLALAWVALCWRVAGTSVVVARLAMLVVAAATVAAAFALAKRLSGVRAAWTCALFLAASPPFFAQDLLVHLDLAAAFFTLLAVRAFVDDRYALCGAACAALVLAKETGLAVPLALSALLVRRPRAGAAVLGPALVALGAWGALLRWKTGHWTGNEEFARYNVGATLDPLRVGAALLWRLYQTLVANAHLVATLAIVVAFARRGALRGRAFGAILAVAGASLLLHSALGGAVLLRYLLPVLALLYVAAAVAIERFRPATRVAVAATFAAGMVACAFVSPPYPIAPEDDLSFVGYVRAQEDAAHALESEAKGRRVTTAWPFSTALYDPRAGYVRETVSVHAIDDFRESTLSAIDPASVDLFALYEQKPEPAGGFAGLPVLGDSIRALARRAFDYVPQASREWVIARFSLRPWKRFDRGGHVVELFERTPPGR